MSDANPPDLEPTVCYATGGPKARKETEHLCPARDPHDPGGGRQAARHLGVVMKLRDKTFLKNNGHCWYCGDEGANQVDHVIARVHGGKDWDDNLVPCCRRCNVVKGKRGVSYLRSYLLCLDVIADRFSGEDWLDYQVSTWGFVSERSDEVGGPFRE